MVGLLLLDHEVNDVTGYHGFKVGERVRIKSRRFDTGKVIHPSEATHSGRNFQPEDYVFIRYDGGHGFGSETGGWLPKNIERIEPVTLTVDSAVSLYTLACERYEAAQLELDRAKDAVRDARIALRDALDGET